jgi:hypothetical protein
MILKLSLLTLYLRFFNRVRTVRIAIYTSIGIIVSFYLSTIIAELAVGIPRPGEGGWGPVQTSYGPFGLNVSAARGVFGVVSDFTILLIPITQIVPLSLPLQRKIILLCIFLTGLLYVLLSFALDHPPCNSRTIFQLKE